MTSFEEAVLAILRRHGPLETREIAERHRFGAAAAISGLVNLEKEGRVARRVRPGTQLGPIWVPGSETWSLAEAAT